MAENKECRVTATLNFLVSRPTPDGEAWVPVIADHETFSFTVIDDEKIISKLKAFIKNMIDESGIIDDIKQ